MEVLYWGPETKPGAKITSLYKTENTDLGSGSGINPKGKRIGIVYTGKVLAFLFLISICLSVSESLVDSSLGLIRLNFSLSPHSINCIQRTFRG